MKKAAISMVLLLFLTGCWDRLPLRNLHIIDIVGVDYDEKKQNVLLNFVVTKLNKAGHGSGEPASEATELTGPSVVEAVGQGSYKDQGPFIGINTRLFLISESFANHNPVRELAFLLDTPYTTINSPIVVYEQNDPPFFTQIPDAQKEKTKELDDFVLTLETYGIVSNVTMMRFLLSKEDPLVDYALPLLKSVNSRIEMNGALLFRQGNGTGVKLSNEQVRALMLLVGNGNAMQKLKGFSSKFDYGRQPRTGHLNDINYAFFTKKVRSKIIVLPKAKGLPDINISVNMRISATELGEKGQALKSDYVNKMEKELSDHLSEMAADTIKKLQEANSDVIGIGKELKAFHPSIWKALEWRKDYPQLLIVPKFEVKILNTEIK
ncbi:Ger(x)C family spore germination C-terminal domain-containing protein [Bacillus sp. 3255]|uniref:Ger(x)C family spore germination C-terminal domain-containing protein n=1 Tax=Bacillus sp. 3255 TaxID=2817904 RepID=UPI0028567BF5|nr:Ger(x)C family spore germination C-terminal domain-containing protein [Bacillus sp. 3255]MDR6881280.1 Ger(x)C family germination protein [Bacillus sp. 3255]